MNMGPVELVLLLGLFVLVIYLLTRGRRGRPAVLERASANIETTQPVITAGYVFAFVMPLIGFILGLTQINRDPAGLRIVILSVVMFFVWLIILGASAA